MRIRKTDTSTLTSEEVKQKSSVKTILEKNTKTKGVGNGQKLE